MIVTLISHIDNSQKLLTNSWKKILHVKTGDLTFFLAKIYLSIGPNTYEFFQIFL